jgi:hypothetical protein
LYHLRGLLLSSVAELCSHKEQVMEVVELVVASDYDSMLLLRGPSQLGQASKRYRIAQSKFPSFDFSGESVKEEVGGAGQDTCWSPVAAT